MVSHPFFRCFNYTIYCRIYQQIFNIFSKIIDNYIFILAKNQNLWYNKKQKFKEKENSYEKDHL